MMQSDTALFLFRRDLRLEDNTGLREACRQARRVIPAFIFDPRQIEPHPYRSEPALRFMLERLNELASQLRSLGGRLYFFRGEPHEVVRQLLARDHVTAVFVNRDYTPFSRDRDLRMEQICSEYGRPFISCGDSVLNEPNAILKDNGRPYTVFTPYWKKASAREVPMPEPRSCENFADADLVTPTITGLAGLIPPANAESHAVGSRREALQRLEHLSQHRNYAAVRDFPALEGTTGLSAYLKFGVVSIREAALSVRVQLGEDHPLMRQLYWRDFFTQIAWHFPHVFGSAFHRQYDHIGWQDNPVAFDRWCTGNTGFPIVDAGMRQLNRTGWMHNRVRMIAASFLVKDLHIDWRAGERYFATRLLDYDPAVNNGNWQWAASTGCDAVPYFRIFNPWLQQAKFDPEADYIRRWLPELAHCSTPAIHKPGTVAERTSGGYPSPMVDHSIAARIARNMIADMKHKSFTASPKPGRSAQ